MCTVCDHYFTWIAVHLQGVVTPISAMLTAATEIYMKVL